MPERDLGLPRLQDWLTRMAAACPGRPAVITGEVTLTIGDLYAQSLSIAAALHQLGVAAGDRVALAMHKSPEAVTAAYGILSAGGILVPVQPDWPRTRIEAILESCDAHAVVSDGESGADARPRVVDRRSGASRDWNGCLAAPPVLELDLSRSPDDPALILFTSGSTGSPKGVTLSHRAVGVFVDWTARQFRLGPDDRIGCPSPLSFDLSTFDVFNIGRSGSAMVVVPQAAIWIPRLLSRLAREARISAWYSVPSQLAHSLEGGLEPGGLDHLRVILFAGEVMPPRVAARLRDAAPGAELCNLYGPTETNVVTWHRLPDQIDTSRPIPIGRACPYARVRLDPATEECQDGQPSGLLLVAGDSLMSGYWNRPAETAEALVSLSDEGHHSLYYRTGDRVVIDSDDQLVFVGRTDRQVKRRGYRIELGEIEAALAGAPSVAEAAAVASELDGAVRVSVFVRSASGTAPGDAELRAHCAGRLPSYMMPDRFLALQNMPRGDRGKIDYGALSRLDRSTP